MHEDVTDPDRRRVVVFDLDGTILAGHSFGRFVIANIRRSRWRTLLALALVPPAGLLFAIPRSKRYGATILLCLATFGASDTEFRTMCAEFAREHASGPTIHQRILSELKTHLAGGDIVIVATACIEPLARQICTALGLSGVRLGATGVHRCGPLQVVEQWCSNGAKVQMITDSGAHMQFDRAYTDTSTDVPLLGAATQRILTNASSGSAWKRTRFQLTKWRLRRKFHDLQHFT